MDRSSLQLEFLCSVGVRGSQAVVFPCLLVESLFNPPLPARSTASGEFPPSVWDGDLRCEGGGDGVLHHLHRQVGLCAG